MEESLKIKVTNFFSGNKIQLKCSSCGFFFVYGGCFRPNRQLFTNSYLSIFFFYQSLFKLMNVKIHKLLYLLIDATTFFM